jgi:lysozyme family protein
MDFFTTHVVPMLGQAEGGYVDHPSDRGGPTNHGITEEVARRFGYKGPMRDLPLATALRIYDWQYVRGPGFDRIARLSVPIAKELVDTGVNMGVAVAGEFFQRALNGLNARQTHYADVVVDGKVGAASRAAFMAYLARRGKIGETVMLRALNALQGARYLAITEGRPANEDFTFGWFANRVVI